MKQIIIFLLIIILLIIGYGQYKQYKRFTLESYEYQVNDSVDLDYHDKAFLLDYYEAIEDLNGYIITQWSANGIDVRTPEEDDEENQFAVKKYTDKLARIKYFENQLLKSAELKSKGMSNSEIKLYEDEGVTMEEKQKLEMKNKILAMFDKASRSVRVGDQSAFIHEVQKLLKSKGHDIPLDGVFRNITTEALRSFETKNGLYPDGKLDVFTLEKLVE